MGLPKVCIDPCIYIDPDFKDVPICFKHGKLPVICNDDGSYTTVGWGSTGDGKPEGSSTKGHGGMTGHGKSTTGGYAGSSTTRAWRHGWTWKVYYKGAWRHGRA